MKRRILESEDAKRDIVHHFVQIGEENLDAAFAFKQSVRESYKIIAQFPAIGRLHTFPKVGPKRMWPVKGFPNLLIFYETTDTSVNVMRILHSSMDYHRVFR